MTEPVPIADPQVPERAAEAAADVVRSGDLRQGEQVKRFEHEFATHVGADHAIAVSSGTAALHVAYLLAGGPNAEVLVPALSHISTASMVVMAGMRPVFCDVDSTGTIDVEDAAERLTADTLAIAPVHLYGAPADARAILELAVDEGLAVIGDAAQAHGTTYHGRDVATLATLTTYSFYPTKHVTTGEGGMIVTDDGHLAQTARLMRGHYQTEKYYHPKVGFNYRLTDIGAAIGRAHLETLDDRLAARRVNAARIERALRGVVGVDPLPSYDPAGHTRHQFTVTCADRDALAEHLSDHGIETAIHYPRPLHKQPAFARSVTLPVAERLCEEVLSLPVHAGLTDEALDRIADALAAFD